MKTCSILARAIIQAVGSERPNSNPPKVKQPSGIPLDAINRYNRSQLKDQESHWYLGPGLH